MFKYFIKASKLYWFFQITGWGLYFIINLFFISNIDKLQPEFIFGFLNVSLTGFILSHFLRYLINRQHWVSKSLIVIGRNIIIATLLFTAIWIAISIPINLYLYRNIPGFSHISLSYLFILYFQFSIILILWQLLYLSVALFRQNKKHLVEKYQLELALKDAELLALKSQINPHFLFNYLNSIRSLILSNPEFSREMITRLSAMFRYSLNYGGKKLVAIKEEIELNQHYLALEKIRFEERLQIAWHIDSKLEDCLIPPFSLQVLLENAIKHGVNKTTEYCHVEVFILSKDNKLILKVINDGKIAAHNPDQRKVGLSNVQQRLQLLFADASTFSIQQQQSKVVCEIILPFLSSHKG